MIQRDPFAWWGELRHQGLFLSPAVIRENFPYAGRRISPWEFGRLRGAYDRLLAQVQDDDSGTTVPGAPVREWLDYLFTDPLGHERARWLKQDQLRDIHSSSLPNGEWLRPHRVLTGANGSPLLLVWIDDARRLGVGRSRKRYSQLLTLLRGTGVKLGLFTNGLQFRLCYAGLDFDSWVEWETEAWFAGSETRDQLYGFLLLLGQEALFPRGVESCQLLQAVEASRTRQGELAQVLGEQVRQAVERLVKGLPPVLESRLDLVTALVGNDGSRLSQTEQWQAFYQASIRLIMRLVVVLYAEARDLLPRDNPVYFHSYSVESLFANLRNARRLDAVEMPERQGAWRQLLSLFRLVHEGSAHPDLPVPAYGGLLFAGGDVTSPDPVRRALTLFEAGEYYLSDLDVYEILRLLKMGKIRIREGHGYAAIPGPVDFSDLRSEYIGIIYQGLLDYGLRRVGDELMVMLGLGAEPVLPLGLLEGLDDKALRDLLHKLGRAEAETDEQESEGSSETGEEDEEKAPEESEEGQPWITGDEDLDADEVQPQAAGEQGLRQRALTWAVRAVEVAGFVKRPRRGEDSLYERQRLAAARKLLKVVLEPGDFYLVRWGGIRKGSGTFYTKPQIAVPLAIRTLEPLCYERQDDGLLRPRSPEEIIALRVVDPAMGSGSFLVAALNYVTEALSASLFAHDRLTPAENGTAVLLLGGPATGREEEELIPCPSDDPRFEEMLRARLKRQVVERCVYGVDLNPLAVELARVSLWVETMDRSLPFEFLDHKLKVGNSLVGCWLDQFAHYPVRAWERDGGDRKHNGVHLKPGDLTKRIKEVYQDDVKPQLRRWLEEAEDQVRWLADPLVSQAMEIQAHLGRLVEALHSVKRADEMENAYWSGVLRNDGYLDLKTAMDRWCSVWFWPVHDDALPLLTPEEFWSPSPVARAGAEAVARTQRFFHWEIEFPEVFSAERGGFDAVLGNPPWDIKKPSSREFFSDRDPVYRAYGRQEALAHRRLLFELDPDVEVDWLRYNADFRAMSNWVANVAEPFTVSLARGKKGKELADRWGRWRRDQHGLADSEHPFRHQGSADLNSFKLFLEVAHQLLRKGGRLGLLVPSGIYSDLGCVDLRRLLLERCRWEWLFGFSNRRKVFDIDSRFKFASLIAEKGGSTGEVRTAFMVDDLSAWENVSPANTVVSAEQVRRLSPKTRSLLEIRSSRDLGILEWIYGQHPLLGDRERCSWPVTYANEFHMTNDSNLFAPIERWLAKGYRPDGLGRWIDPEGDIALPLYEGRMIGQFDFSSKGWVSGKGRQAIWHEIPWESKTVEPQYLMGQRTYAVEKPASAWNKVGMINVSSSTNTRTMVAAYTGPWPCGNSVPTLSMPETGLPEHLALVTVLNSFVYDYIVRHRVAGINLNFFYLEETPLPRVLPPTVLKFVTLSAAALNLAHRLFAPQWVELASGYLELRHQSWRTTWATDPKERLRLRCELDALVAHLYGLSYDDFAFILRTDESDPAGFWRVDKNLPLDKRQTTLTLQAYRHLQNVGIDAFCEKGWKLPAGLFPPVSAVNAGDPSDWAEAESLAAELGRPYGSQETARAAEESGPYGSNGPRDPRQLKLDL
ncbi:MAG: Eco57I restriction-modification methylase domain-containing protein [Thermoleophilia bacterium]